MSRKVLAAALLAAVWALAMFASYQVGAALGRAFAV